MRIVLLLLATLLSIETYAQGLKIPRPQFSGIYFQWGYNRDWYSKSDFHMKGDDYDFTIYDVVAKDKPDFSSFRNTPWDITIPQNSYRLGMYLNKKRTHAIEINYDHAKYVQVDNQKLHLKGNIKGEYIDDIVDLGQYFVHVEHTNGANFYHLNYVGQTEILHNKKKNRPWATAVWKAGGGVVIPKSFIILFYEKLDNKFHVAGYIFSAEAGLRFYPFKNLFLEATVKGGYANYVNALAIGTGRFSHDFYYAEVLGHVGYDMSLGFLQKKKKEPKVN
jgi:hypothetical protein